MSDPGAEATVVVREWLRKGDEDLTAVRLLMDGHGPVATVCFHVQQAVEKYLKAVLVANGIPFGRTHDIQELIELLPAPQRPGLDAQTAAELTEAAVALRYPEAPEPSAEQTDRLVRLANDVRRFVRGVLPAELLEP
jgi:HEPN domain-containing protein